MTFKALMIAAIIGLASSAAVKDASSPTDFAETTLSGPQLQALFKEGTSKFPGQDLKVKLLLDSTLHGKTPAIFHQLVDGVPNTYTVVTLRDPVSAQPLAILGGYTEIAWSSVESMHTDRKAFLFAFDKPDSPALITSGYKWKDSNTLDLPNIVHSPDSGFDFSEALSFSPVRNPYTGLTLPSDPFLDYFDLYDEPFYDIPYHVTDLVLHLYTLNLPQDGIWYNEFTYVYEDSEDEAEAEIAYDWTYVVFTMDAAPSGSASSPAVAATATAPTAEVGSGNASDSKHVTAEEATNRADLRAFFKGRKIRKGFLAK